MIISFEFINFVHFKKGKLKYQLKNSGLHRDIT